MRVACQTLEDFLANLAADAALPDGRCAVLQKTVRAATIRRAGAAKVPVVFQASAVVELDGGGQYLLELGADCGYDYDDATQEELGSEQASKLRRRLAAFCQEHGYRILPGVIGT